MIIGNTLYKPAIKIQINGRLLEQVKSYVYLGHTITEDGKCYTEIRKRIGMPKSYKMKSILTSKQFTNKLKMRIARCYVYSVLLYGSKSWTKSSAREIANETRFIKRGENSTTEILRTYKKTREIGNETRFIKRDKDSTTEIL
jgi:hypothetical protein